jgi:hypothetical protein
MSLTDFPSGWTAFITGSKNGNIRNKLVCATPHIGKRTALWFVLRSNTKEGSISFRNTY